MMVLSVRDRCVQTLNSAFDAPPTGGGLAPVEPVLGSPVLVVLPCRDFVNGVADNSSLLDQMGAATPSSGVVTRPAGSIMTSTRRAHRMTSRKLRTIRVGSLVCFWRVHHRHEPDSAPGTRRCLEVFTAFQEGHPSQPLRILFPETDEHGPGFPGQRGVVVDYRAPTRPINLNRPRIARLLIELGLASGWAANSSPRELLVVNGYQLLRKHAAELHTALEADSAVDPSRVK